MSNPNIDPNIYRTPSIPEQQGAGKKSWLSTQLGRVTGLLGEVLSGTGDAVAGVVTRVILILTVVRTRVMKMKLRVVPEGKVKLT